MREVACPGATRTLLVADIVGEPQAAWVQLAARATSRTDAAPWALLSIVRDGLLPKQFNYRVWPNTNAADDAPSGAPPEMRAIITANRDRRFMLGIALCEGSRDAFGWDLTPNHACARVIGRALCDVGYPAMYDPDIGCERVMPDRATESFLIIANPASAPWDDRLAMHRVAVSAALAACGALPGLHKILPPQRRT